jgi:hypothetical protein
MANPMGDDEVEVGQEDDVFLKRLEKEACSKVSNCEVLTTLKGSLRGGASEPFGMM